MAFNAQSKYTDFGGPSFDPSSLESYDMIKNLTNASGYTKPAMDLVNLNRQKQIDAATRESTGGMNDMLSRLASRGGVGAGTRERLAQTAGTNLMDAKQQAYGQANSNMLDVLKQGELLKRQGVGDFAKTELDLRKLAADKWAAGKQADAIQRSSEGGK